MPDFRPSNSGVAGIAPKRIDWKQKSTRAMVDFGRKRNVPISGAILDRRGTPIPGLGPGPRKFLERIWGGEKIL